ncbi:S53 family peptidase [Rhizobium ruizarguesonis]|uniref:S53 family peptidase n=1 Tax=Rhizobium ruizarguesonis TaxID=2081791 RepID=UPI0013EF1D1E|nr:S53 family peptidase [Rhizobium ruizarguesonis]
MALEWLCIRDSELLFIITHVRYKYFAQVNYKGLWTSTRKRVTLLRAKLRKLHLSKSGVWSMLSARCLTLSALMMVGVGLTSGHAEDAANTTFKEFPSSIVKLPPPSGPSVAAEPLSNALQKQLLEVHFTLETGDLTALQDKVVRGEKVSSEEFAKSFSSDPEASQKLADYLSGKGWTIVNVSNSTGSLFASAPVSVVAKTLDTKMINVVDDMGQKTVSAVTPPKLPIDVGMQVIAIDGLQPGMRAVRHIVRQGFDIPGPSNAAAADAPIPSPSHSEQSSYKVADILNAYNGTGLPVTGHGQTIAILIDTFPSKSDLAKFWKANKVNKDLSRVSFIDVQKLGTHLPNKSAEETLDVEWASGVAPDAKIQVYAAGSLHYVALDLALNKILSETIQGRGPEILSISLGLREDLVSVDELKTESSLFLKLAALGVTTFVSSGDAGSNPDETGHGHGDVTKVEYEASDPSVVAVGGTTLHMRADGAVDDESGWLNSGGGISGTHKRPAWQKAYAGLPNTTLRLVPDVSADADPSPGGYVVLDGKSVAYGGTSWSAPIWAGIAARLNEDLVKQGKQTGFMAPRLYAVSDTAAFRQINSGENGAYKAGPGWDPVTGLGVPNIGELIRLYSQTP